MAYKQNSESNDAALIFSQNHVDYPTVVWAVYQFGGVISFIYIVAALISLMPTLYRGANPDFTSDELLYQLQQTNTSLMIVHPDLLDIALSTARHANFPRDKIILFNTGSNLPGSRLTVADLIQQELDLSSDQSFVETRLHQGEAKSKVAFLSFSSGTTGKPKDGAGQLLP